MSIAPGEFLTRRRRRSRVPLRFTPGWYACGVFPRCHLLKALIAECDYAKQKRSNSRETQSPLGALGMGDAVDFGESELLGESSGDGEELGEAEAGELP